MLAPIIYDFLKAKRYSIGQISERKDGFWKKIGPGGKDWILVKRKRPQGAKNKKESHEKESHEKEKKACLKL